MFVRLAMEYDIEPYVELARQGAEESSRHVGFNPEKVRDTFRQYLAEAHPTIWVVEDKREIIAFMNATISSYNFADGIFTTQEILFVRKDRRGGLAAARLLQNFCDWSDKLGALESTGGNDNALHSEQTKKLLSRFGFEEVGYFMRRVGQQNG